MENSFWKKYCKCRAIPLILIIFLALSLIYYNRGLNRVNEAIKKPNESSQPYNLTKAYKLSKSYKLLTPGCTIDELNLQDSSLKRFFEKHQNRSCPRKPGNLLIYQTEDGYLRVDPEAKKQLSAFKNNTQLKFECTKREVYRLQWEKNAKNPYRVSSNVTTFTKWALMDTEFAEVKCKVADTQVYHDYFFSVIRKPKVESESETNRKIFLKNNANCAKEPQLSVLILGIDSLSKSNFLRQMPLTLEVLTTQLSAIDMSGYNKVGINTFPSLVPYLIGYSSKELLNGCWRNHTFDNCTFIWDLFAKAGYRTAFVENMDNFALFNSQGRGIHRQLAHYLGHTVYPLAYKHSLKSKCWRGEPEDFRVVQWARMFQKEFAGDLHFGHFWMSMLSHGDVNGAERLDEPISETFKQMNEEKMLNNTLVIFMSDHGLKFGSYRETETGRKDDNLPFMYLVFPSWFRERHPMALQTVKNNGERLITTFDLHETLKSIISCDYTKLSVEKPEKKRGISFFKPISEFRTCADAGIPVIYCGCRQNVVEVSNSSTISKHLAGLVVDGINNYTVRSRNVCAEFRLNEILYVKKVSDLSTIDEVERNSTIESEMVSSYIVSVLVQPGAAKFETTLRSFEQNNSYVLDSDVRRINKYGNSSYCVSDDPFLKPICFCTEIANKEEKSRGKN